MGHKKKFGPFEVEKEPFIYQKQFNYFITNFNTTSQLGASLERFDSYPHESGGNDNNHGSK